MQQTKESAFNSEVIITCNTETGMLILLRSFTFKAKASRYALQVFESD